MKKELDWSFYILGIDTDRFYEENLEEHATYFSNRTVS